MTAEATVLISVIQLVPGAIEFTEQPYRFQVVENDPQNTLIGTVQARDTNSTFVPPSIIIHNA